MSLKFKVDWSARTDSGLDRYVAGSKPFCVIAAMTDRASDRLGAAMSSVHPRNRLGAMTWKPRPEGAAPSAWMLTSNSAPPRSAIRARSQMHGP